MLYVDVEWVDALDQEQLVAVDLPHAVEQKPLAVLDLLHALEKEAVEHHVVAKNRLAVEV